MTLDASEFIRRFLIHILPPGFQRIRYFGFLANCHRQRRLGAILRLLSSPASALLPGRAECRQVLRELRQRFLQPVCPRCGRGLLAPVQILPRYRWPAVPPEDSS